MGGSTAKSDTISESISRSLIETIRKSATNCKAASS